MKLIKRPFYLEKLRLLKGEHLIKVIAGVRRSGKSTLFKLFINELKEKVPPDQILQYNFEDAQNSKYCEDWFLLHKEILEQTSQDKPYYLFFDEIQQVKNFEKLIDSLQLRDNFDIYITGSNSYMLSGELSTLLTGRYIQIDVLPFSFTEYLNFFEDKSRTDILFQKFLNYGGFPQAITLQKIDPNLTADYHTDLYKSIIQKDIKKRFKFTAKNSFEIITKFLFDSIGSEISANNIKEHMSKEGIKLSTHTVLKYISALSQSFIFYSAQRYDTKGKRLLKTQSKFYAVDTGLRNSLLARPSGQDLGHLLENIVFLELKRRGGQVYIGKAGNKQVDFIHKDKQGFITYYQVSYSVRDLTTLERELSAFKAIKDANPKILLTMDAEEPVHNGIRQINAINWLLNA
ncbi:MAG: ATP-binding protein [Elusimicrobiota bacterium]|jgi:predicted AAA+ superfamily ATPase|nr:ATP-binding protein [Elusimicrobiota bacterium]